MNKQPEQTAQTRRDMIDAFWIVAKARGIDKTTISDVMKKAGFNRGTFYVYFSDIEDLRSQAEKEIIDELRSHIEPLIKDLSTIDMQSAARQVTQVFSQYDDKLFLLLGEHGDPHFAAEIREAAGSFFQAVFPSLSENPHGDYITAACASAFIGMLTYWHEKGRAIPIEEIALQIHRLIVSGLSGLQNT